MKKAFKSLLLASTTGLMALTLASCGGETRNSSVPYGEGNKYNSDTVIATASNDITNETMKMTLAQFYSRLRYSGNTFVTNNIKKAVYSKEYDAVVDVLTHENLADVKDSTKALITLTKNDTPLYSLSATTLDATGELNNYQYIRRYMVNAIQSLLSSGIFSATSAKKVADIEDKVIEKYYTKYIETQARRGITITKAELAFQQPTDNSDVIQFTNFKSIVLNYRGLVDSFIITQSEKLASKNALYQIADEEYIYEYDADPSTDEKTKNSSNYLFDEKKMESLYNTTYKTYGEYKAVIIQFNSRREALKITNEATNDLTSCHALDKTFALSLAIFAPSPLMVI